MKTLIISLESSKERRTHMEKEMRNLGIPYENYQFVEAVDASIFPVPDYKLACLQSHRKAWQMVAESDAPTIILEDDVILSSRFSQTLTHYHFCQARMHVGLLGYQLKGAPLWNTTVNAWRFAQPGRHIEYNGAYAYIVDGAAAANHLLQLSENVVEFPDLLMMESAKDSKLNLFFLQFPTVQHGSFPSTLKHYETQPAVKTKAAARTGEKNKKSDLAPQIKPTAKDRKPFKGKKRLFVNWYVDKNTARNMELLECFNKNVDSGLFDEIVNLGELKSSKCKNVKVTGRPSFEKFFAQVNKLAGPDDISVIANLDIYFDKTIQLCETMAKSDVFALTRYDMVDGLPVFFNRADSQDVWIFKGKIKAVKEANFNMGEPGCDNKLAYLLHKAKYNVTNPSLSVKTYHVHKSAVRNGKAENMLQPPYKLITPTFLQ